MINTFKYCMFVLIMLYLWANIDSYYFTAMLMLFGMSITMVFYLFCMLIFWIDDFFNECNQDFHLYK